MKNKQYEVYVVTVEDDVLYVGQGKLGRHQHCLSGTSHVYGLNRLHFGGVYLTVNVIETFETKGDAEIRELDLIKALNPKFNTKFNGDANIVGMYNRYYLQQICNVIPRRLDSKNKDGFNDGSYWDDSDVDYLSISEPIFFKQDKHHYSIDVEKNIFDINTIGMLQYKDLKFHTKLEVESFCYELFMGCVDENWRSRVVGEDELNQLLKDCMYRIEYT